MKRFPQPRKATRLSGLLRQHLDMYALAATSAGAGLLPMAQPAEAKIVYTPAHRVIAPQNSFQLDLNHDGRIDFTIENRASCGTDMCHYSLFQRPARAGNSAIGYLFESQLLLDSALQRCARIGPGKPFQPGTAGMVDVVYSEGGESTNVFGQWANVQFRYLGLKFQIDGQTHYGWARFNVEVRNRLITATLTGYAYETIPNKTIITGKIKGQDDAEQLASVKTYTRGPAALGMLAMGSAGLSIWRREESVTLARESN